MIAYTQTIPHVCDPTHSDQIIVYESRMGKRQNFFLTWQNHLQVTYLADARRHPEMVFVYLSSCVWPRFYLCTLYVFGSVESVAVSGVTALPHIQVLECDPRPTHACHGRLSISPVSGQSDNRWWAHSIELTSASTLFQIVGRTSTPKLQSLE